MTEPFVDITIVGVDTANTRNIRGALYEVPLTLSARPPSEWATLFDAARKFPRHSMWRRAHISGDKISVECCLDEVEQYHLSDLIEDVATANLRYRAHLVEVERANLRRAEAVTEERARIEKALRGLKFPPK